MRTTLRISFALLFGTLLLSSASQSQAQDLIGAQKVLDKIQPAGKQSLQSSQQDWPKAIGELPAQLAKLAPPQAAADWLKIYDAWVADFANHASSARHVTFQNLIDTLPAPAAWPELVKLIDARPIPDESQARIREILLRILGHRLLSQSDQVRRNLDQALQLSKEKKPPKTNIIGALLGTSVFASGQQHDWRPDVQSQLQIVKTEIDPLSVVEEFKQSLQGASEQRSSALSVPDLVKLAGRDQATPLLEQTLLVKQRELYFNSSEDEDRHETETIKLAREIARKNLAKIQIPQWNLCRSIDTADLYEAFRKLPPKKGAPQDAYRWSRNSATPWYLIGLIIKNRHDDAVKCLVELESKSRENSDSPGQTAIFENVTYFEKAGYLKNIHTFLTAALTAHPELHLWTPYVTASARLRKSTDALALIDTILSRQDLPPKTRQNINRVRVSALFAADRVDEGIATLTPLMQDALAQAPAAKQPSDGEESEGISIGYGALASPFTVSSQRADDTPLKDAIRIAEIGHLMNRDEWVRIGSDAGEKIILDRLKNSDSFTYGDSQLEGVIGLLITLRQFGRAESILTQVLTADAKRQQAQGIQNFNFFPSNDNSPLELLARVYHAAGRSADVLILVEQALGWNREDIAAWIQNDTSRLSGSHQDSTLSFPGIVAQALAQAGRKAEARPIVEASLLISPGSDPLWQLALDLLGDDFDKFAQKIFERDRFEERPLIWQARFALNRNQLARAEELVRQAISIDPSDGEQGRGDRMRAYAILAEILHKKMDEKNAKIFDGAIQAIRLSEDADRFYSAGLLSRGIKMYNQSLAFFADAYCIQSRLALRLVEQGDIEAATAHYQRAFELMPDSFGRVESHCFGCEGVFQGPVAENIAARVFTKLAAERPKDPKVHYLLGYLYSSQSRHSQALAEFRTAVQLDPDYLNAWERILMTENAEHPISDDLRDEAAFNLLRLDPLGRHVNGLLTNRDVRDLAKFWTILNDNALRFPDQVPAKLLELKAAAAKRKNGPTVYRQNQFDVSEIEPPSYAQATLFHSHKSLEAIASAFTSVMND